MGPKSSLEVSRVRLDWAGSSLGEWKVLSMAGLESAELQVLPNTKPGWNSMILWQFLTKEAVDYPSCYRGVNNFEHTKETLHLQLCPRSRQKQGENGSF